MDESPPTSTWVTPSNMNSRRAAGGPVQPDGPLVPAKTASPKLSDELFARLRGLRHAAGDPARETCCSGRVTWTST